MPPLITSITPDTAQPGDRVRIFGTGFVATPRVVFKTLVAKSVFFISATELEVYVPNVGPQVMDVTVINPDFTSHTFPGFEMLPPSGWGLQAYGLSSYGASSAGAVNIVSALALSTREVEVTVSGPVQDNSPFLEGDALNPATWMVQRLDTLQFLNVVNVAQSGAFKYVLLTFEEFGPVSVTHRASTTTLLDTSGVLIATPREADFLGIADAVTVSPAARLAARQVSARDIANSQTPVNTYLAGTLQVTANGDYQIVTGTELVKKLLIRRLLSRPGDFFHLPNYGIDFKLKEPIAASDLPKLKAEIERQALLEPEIESVQARLTLNSKGVLTTEVRARIRQSGESISIGLPSEQVVL